MYTCIYTGLPAHISNNLTRCADRASFSPPSMAAVAALLSIKPVKKPEKFFFFFLLRTAAFDVKIRRSVYFDYKFF